MKKAIVVLIWIMLLSVPYRVYAVDWNELNGLLDESLQLVKQEKYDKAKQVLTYFSEEFAAFEGTDDFQPEHIRVMSMTYEKAWQAIGEEAVSQREKEDYMLALRLLIDAESSEYRPLWVERKQLVMSAFVKAEEAVKEQDDARFQQVLNEFLYEFDIVYPSLTVDLPKEQLARVNAHLSYLEDQRNLMAKSESGQIQMKVIHKELEEVFAYVHKDEADPSLIWVMISTGGIIIFTLAYVGWRKYKGEQEKRKRPVQSKDE